MNDRFPARLHVIFAREKDRAVVFRRGPSKSVSSYLWDRKTDRFTLGQWFKGRIYERRSDLSPDGSFMIYFAMNGKWQSEARGSWTAISRTPWLKALTLHPQGDCWNGGGLFTTKRKYWLNASSDEPLRVSSKVEEDQNYKPDKSFGNECTGVYYVRLLRDGWILKGHQEIGEWNAQSIFEKPLPKNWVLRKIAHEQVDSPAGKGSYWDEHELENTVSGMIIRCEGWEWAALDRHSLTYAQSGSLYRSTIQSNEKIGDPIMLYDFNMAQFEKKIAPY